MEVSLGKRWHYSGSVYHLLRGSTFVVNRQWYNSRVRSILLIIVLILSTTVGDALAGQQAPVVIDYDTVLLTCANKEGSDEMSAASHFEHVRNTGK